MAQKTWNNHSPKDYVPENQKTDSKGRAITDGTAFRLHFKGGRRIAKIEFDFVPSSVNYKILSNAINFCTVTDEGKYITQWKSCPVNEVNGLMQMNTGTNHLFYNFYYEKNGLCQRDIGYKAENSLSDSIVFVFSQGRDLETYASFGITISNLKITMM